ncbi:unnamed protein product [Nesidiocoris tenuis]|uniref:Uncharacterized protein n=1 Tax=Nesidiocoris tenuis TaxID=355587 RepID=A0A6H5GN63_9HEMI|nr:unnamed protein product [Nesidiocoris tenuis]
MLNIQKCVDDSKMNALLKLAARYPIAGRLRITKIHIFIIPKLFFGGGGFYNNIHFVVGLVLAELTLVNAVVVVVVVASDIVGRGRPITPTTAAAIPPLPPAAPAAHRPDNSRKFRLRWHIHHTYKHCSLQSSDISGRQKTSYYDDGQIL